MSLLTETTMPIDTKMQNDLKGLESKAKSPCDFIHFVRIILRAFIKQPQVYEIKYNHVTTGSIS